jgi:hypothetical protein
VESDVSSDEEDDTDNESGGTSDSSVEEYDGEVYTKNKKVLPSNRKF